MIHVEAMGPRAAEQEEMEGWDPHNHVACLPVQAPQYSRAPKMGELPVPAPCCIPNLLLQGQKVPLVHPTWENQSFPITPSASADTGKHVPTAKPLYGTSCSGWSDPPARAKAGCPGSTTRLTPLPRGLWLCRGNKEGTCLAWQRSRDCFYPPIGEPVKSVKKAGAASLFSTLHDPYLAG